MPFFVISLILSGVGTLFSLWLLIDAREDRRVAHRINNQVLLTLTQHRFLTESIRLTSQVLFLITSLLLLVRTPGTFTNTIRFLFTGVILFLTLGSFISYWSKRNFLKHFLNDSEKAL